MSGTDHLFMLFSVSCESDRAAKQCSAQTQSSTRCKNIPAPKPHIESRCDIRCGGAVPKDPAYAPVSQTSCKWLECRRCLGRLDGRIAFQLVPRACIQRDRKNFVTPLRTSDCCLRPWCMRV